MTAYRRVRIDPHVHTAASYDGHATPEQVLARAEDIGLDAVVVTDHDTLEGARVACRLAPRYDVAVVPGCEVSTADGHLLAVGVTAPVEPGVPLTETAARVRERGGAAVVPHPFQRWRHGARADAIAGVDAIEVCNAQTLTGLRNAQARRFARRRGYAALGGSDAHVQSLVARAATELRVPAAAALDPDTVVEAIRAGRTRPVGRRAPMRRYVGKLVRTAAARTAGLL